MKNTFYKVTILISVLSLALTAAPPVCAEEQAEDGKATLGTWAAEKAADEAADAVSSEESTEQQALLGDQEEPPESQADYGLPIMNITLSGTDLATINSGSKETKYAGNTVSITYSKDTSCNITKTNVEIKGHGNSTWLAAKKPYQIKFSNKTSLCGLPAAKKFILLANAYDPTAARDTIASDLAASIGLASCKGVNIDLYIDGQYLGDYLLTQKVDSNIIGLSDDNGVLMEIDDAHWYEYGIEPDPYINSSINKTHITLKDSVSSDAATISAAMDSFKTSYDTLEKAAKDGDWNTIQSCADVNSIAEYYLLSELSANPDTSSSSFYLYKDGDSDILHAGPAWDYDIAFGSPAGWNKNYFKDTGRLWIVNDPSISSEQTCFILAELMNISEFRDLVKGIWQNTMRNAVDQEIMAAGTLESEITDSMHADSALWNSASFENSYVSLLNWISARKNYLDRVFGTEASVADGAYTITTCNGKSYVGGIGNIELENSSSTNYQIFDIAKNPDGYYSLKNAGTGKYLDVYGGSTAAGANIWSYPGNGTYAQQWKIMDNGDGTYTFLNRICGMAMDAACGNISAGTNIQIYSSNGTNAQKYILTAASERKSLIDTVRTYTICSALSGGRVTDISGGSNDTGVNVQLWNSNGTGAQKFRFTMDSNGYYTIINVKSGKVIDVSGGSHSNGANVQQWDSNGTNAQKWAACAHSDGSITFINAGSGKALDVSCGQSFDGSNIQQYEYNGTLAQSWILKAA